MIRLPNGHKFEYMVASGALAFDGKGWPWEWPLRWVDLIDNSLFTIVIKTLTRYPRKGNLKWYNPLGCIRPMRGGAVNSVGLTNKGIDWWCQTIGPKVDSKKISLVGSIFSSEVKELVEMAKILNDFDLVGLEINASCPNTSGDILENTKKIIESCESVKKGANHPLILKLSVVHDIDKILPEVKDIIEAISINSVPWKIIFPQKKSSLAHLGGGGVSGKIAQPLTWMLVDDLVRLTEIPVIGPSVWDFEDIEKLREIGAKAISFGSIFLCHPWRPTMFVKKDMKRNHK